MIQKIILDRNFKEHFTCELVHFKNTIYYILYVAKKYSIRIRIGISNMHKNQKQIYKKQPLIPSTTKS